jgi:hypothetical protein
VREEGTGWWSLHQDLTGQAEDGEGEGCQKLEEKTNPSVGVVPASCVCPHL